MTLPYTCAPARPVARLLAEVGVTTNTTALSTKEAL